MNSVDPSLLLQCEREPLANSGLIQPNGVFLFIDKVSGCFSAVSENSALLTGEEPGDLLDQDGKDWLEQNMPSMSYWPTSAGRRMLFPRGVDLGMGDLDVLVSCASTGWLVELEPSREAATDIDKLALPLPPGNLDAQSLGRMRQDLVEAISSATGYDRVMLYQFHPDWSGEVLAEVARSSNGAYLGLRFPASDIPAIARALYAQTPYRHIPNSSAKPVAINTRAGSGALIDLTWSDLRSVSPVHLQYLANMNVLSSFSVSVMMDGKLWGLLACHHPTPQVIPLAARERCKLLAAEFSQAMSAYRTSVQRELYASALKVIAPVGLALQQGQPIVAALEPHLPELAALTQSTGIAIMVDDHLTLWGDLRSAHTPQAVHTWCVKTQSEPVYFIDNLPFQMGPDGLDGQTCGVLGIALRSKAPNNALVHLYLLRKEEAGEIAWAGNPDKPVEQTAQGQSLSPRSSFDRWVEVRTGHSRAWSEDARFVGRQLRDMLSAVV